MRCITWQAEDENHNPITVDLFFASHLDPDVKRDTLDIQEDVEYDVTEWNVGTLEDHLAITVVVAQRTFQGRG